MLTLFTEVSVQVKIKMVLSVALQKIGRIFVDVPERLSTHVEKFFYLYFHFYS